MEREIIIDIVDDIFAGNGINIDNQKEIEEMDSLEYISILVGLEEKFDIEFPDSMLIHNMFIDKDAFFDLLEFLLANR